VDGCRVLSRILLDVGLGRSVSRKSRRPKSPTVNSWHGVHPIRKRCRRLRRHNPWQGWRVRGPLMGSKPRLMLVHCIQFPGGVPGRLADHGPHSNVSRRGPMSRPAQRRRHRRLGAVRQWTPRL
jgi:hypothetical protein